LFALFERVQELQRDGEIEALRRALKRDVTPLAAPDAGAGSRVPGELRTVARAARWSLKPPREAQRMARLAEGLKAQSVLELGTCLGLTTAYLARTGAHVITIEADPILASRARETWKTLQLHDAIDGLTGTFAEQLEVLAAAQSGFDLIVVDGHHHGPALLAYLRQLRPWLRERELPTAIVCDDIRWSRSMWEAWQMARKEWPVSVDLGSSGWLMQGPRLTPFHRAVRL
jgi:predicted O-methyltransferase YrrM